MYSTNKYHAFKNVQRFDLNAHGTFSKELHHQRILCYMVVENNFVQQQINVLEFPVCSAGKKSLAN